MPNKEKIEKVKQIKKWFEKADSLIVLHYMGLKVSEAAELRAQIKGGGNEMRVLKNTLTKIALEGTEREPLVGVIDGPSAVVFVKEDIAATARLLREFSRGRSGLFFEGGMMGERLLSAKDVDSISILPPREVLLAQMACTLQAPLTRLAGVVIAPARKMIGLFKALEDKLAAEAPAAAPEVAAPAEEPAAQEVAAPAEEPAAQEVAAPAEEPAAEATEETAEQPAEEPALQEAVPDAGEAAVEEAEEAPAAEETAAVEADEDKEESAGETPE